MLEPEAPWEGARINREVDDIVEVDTMECLDNEVGTDVGAGVGKGFLGTAGGPVALE